MADEVTNREAYRVQQRYCSAMDAPITARICAALAEGLTRETRTGARALDWPGAPTPDALPLRTVGGLRALDLAGQDAALSRVFAGEVTEEDAIVVILRASFAAHDEALYPWLDGPPQTNEPARSGALMAGLLHVAARFGQPLEILEIGSSAGLNLLIDRYRFDLGGLLVGPADAAVTIRPEWRGVPAVAAELAFAGVRGVDIQPIDATDPAAAERLRAYVWADNPERLARLTGAIAMLREKPVALEAGDAADWLEARLAAPQASGVTRVVMHSVVWQYLGEVRQARIVAALEAVGARASAAKPLAWVQMEPDRGISPRQEVWVRTWPEGAAAVKVAHAHAHGAWVEGLD